ncbi:site-specific integrase (plasmid) [Azospirillum sp. A29]|uniref:site-specific integrase n=1 Tax=Azospirillum sp. A29 TaxID=3160606 RepID=UPI00366E37E0
MQGALRLVRTSDLLFPEQVVLPDETADLMLTLFLKEATLRASLSRSSVRPYLYKLMPLRAFERDDPVVQREGWSLLGPEAEVRAIIDRYLRSKLACDVKPGKDRLGLEVLFVQATGRSPPGVNDFLAAVGCLYHVLRRCGFYRFKHPLMREDLQQVEQALRDARYAAYVATLNRGPMPPQSGVDPVLPTPRVSSRHFALRGAEWRPIIVSDPLLYPRLRLLAKAAGWRLRELAILELLFQTGARISEVCALTLGDWAASNFLCFALSIDKGSRGERWKRINFDNPAAALLRNYVERERRVLDSQHRGMQEFQAQHRLGRLDPSAPLFLTHAGRAINPN